MTISNALEKCDFVIAIVSRNSIKSAWVQKELSLALTDEILLKKVVVLPIVIDDVKLPYFLRDRLYGDFRDENDFYRGYVHLLRSVGKSGLNDQEIPSTRNFEIGKPIELGRNEYAFDVHTRNIRKTYQFYLVSIGVGLFVMTFSAIWRFREIVLMSFYFTPLVILLSVIYYLKSYSAEIIINRDKNVLIDFGHYSSIKTFSAGWQHLFSKYKNNKSVRYYLLCDVLAIVLVLVTILLYFVIGEKIFQL